MNGERTPVGGVRLNNSPFMQQSSPSPG